MTYDSGNICFCYRGCSLDLFLLRSFRGVRMSKHNHLVWDDFLLCLGMEIAFGDDPIDEQKVAEKIMSLGGRL